MAVTVKGEAHRSAGSHTTVTGEPASPASPACPLPATACPPILNSLDPRQILRQLHTRQPVGLLRPLRLGPRLGRLVRVAQPLLQGGQLLIHLDIGKMDNQLMLLDLDEPLDNVGGGPSGGLSGLLCLTRTACTRRKDDPPRVGT